MRYRKLIGDYLFDGYCFLPSGKALITDSFGKIMDITESADAGDEVEYYKGIISPGFINAHCHLELSHLKGIIPEKTGLIDFVFKVVTLRHSEQEEIIEAIDNAEKEMLENGIVALGDICNKELTVF